MNDEALGEDPDKGLPRLRVLEVRNFYLSSGEIGTLNYMDEMGTVSQSHIYR